MKSVPSPPLSSIPLMFKSRTPNPPGLHTDTGLWPVRNWAVLQEVSSLQASEKLDLYLQPLPITHITA